MKNQTEFWTLPPDVLGIISFYIEHKRGEEFCKREQFFLKKDFVEVIGNILNKHNIPCDYPEVLPENCRNQVSLVCWEFIDDIIRNIESMNEIKNMCKSDKHFDLLMDMFEDLENRHPEELKKLIEEI